MTSASFFFVFVALACSLIAVHGLPGIADPAGVETPPFEDPKGQTSDLGVENQDFGGQTPIAPHPREVSESMLPSGAAPEPALHTPNVVPAGAKPEHGGTDPTLPTAKSTAKTGTDPKKTVAGKEHPRTSRGTIVIVIDDVGYNMDQLEPFLKFPGSITMAVLPNVPYTKKAAEATVRSGKELILHQPMEAIGDLNEGDGALLAGMSRADLVRTIEKNMMQVPGAIGVNNHMGSAATRDALIMETLLDTSRRLGLYFLDSMTIRDSLASPTAALMRMKIWERDVFLDNQPDRDYMVRAVEEGKRIASRYGRAILIGHVWSAELADTLMDLYPGLVEEGFTLSTISKIMQEEARENPGD